MSLAQARVVDPVLSKVVQGYKHATHVGSMIFPSVEVSVSAGNIIEFGKEDFQLFNARRAAGGATKRIEFGYEGKPYSLVQDSLESKIPREYARDASQVPEGAIDSLSEALVSGDWKGALESIATDIQKYVIEASASTPIRNSLFQECFQ